MNRFDEQTHTYWLGKNGSERRVPSVTQVLGGVIGQSWYASDFHLNRGSAVHACCAFVARGIKFDHDSRITGQIAACRRFLREFDCKVIEIEEPHFSERYQYAGTPDLIAGIGDKARVVIDYKASLTPMIDLQLGGYGELVNVNWGLGVELHEDGTYKTTRMIDLRRPRREFLTLRSAFQILTRLNRIKEGNDVERTTDTIDACTGA